MAIGNENCGCVAVAIRLRAASWRRSTSFGVRYSRSRRSVLRGRRGVTVRFTMVEGSRGVLGFPVTNAGSDALFAERYQRYKRGDAEQTAQWAWWTARGASELPAPMERRACELLPVGRAQEAAPLKGRLLMRCWAVPVVRTALLPLPFLSQ
jgi:hypothetical protein